MDIGAAGDSSFIVQYRNVNLKGRMASKTFYVIDSSKRWVASAAFTKRVVSDYFVRHSSKSFQPIAKDIRIDRTALTDWAIMTGICHHQTSNWTKNEIGPRALD